MDSVVLVRRAVKEKGNSEFKPALICQKTTLTSYSGRCEGVGCIHTYIHKCMYTDIE